jgi:hypothetical protein
MIQKHMKIMYHHLIVIESSPNRYPPITEELMSVGLNDHDARQFAKMYTREQEITLNVDQIVQEIYSFVKEQEKK